MFTSRRIVVSLVLLVLVVTVVLGCAKPPPVSPAPVSTAAPKSTPASTSAAPVAPSPTAKPAATGSAQVSFAGKTITIIVPLGAGGSADVRARVYAKYLPQYLPGKPDIIVRNMPGGEEMISANYVWSSKPDGLTLLIATSGVMLGDLLEKPAKKYSTSQMSSVLAHTENMVYAFKSSTYDKSADILKAKGIAFGSSAGGAGTMFILVRELVGFPVDKVVLAYAGGGDARRAFLAGEITAVGVSAPAYSTFKELVDKGEAKLLFQNGNLDEKGNLVRGLPWPPDVLTAGELYKTVLGKEPSGMAWEAYKAILVAAEATAGPLMLPPNTPDSIKKAYWDAAERMIKDTQFLATTSDMYGAHIKWMAGAAFDDMLRKQVVLKPEVRDWYAQLLGAKYGLVVK